MLLPPKSRAPMAGMLAQSAIARFGDQMAAIVYGWGLLDKTGNSWASSLVIAASLGALVAGTLFAGRLIARFGARTVALAGAWSSVAAAVALALLFAAGVSDPFLVAAIAAAGAALDGPAVIAAETNYPQIARLARFDLVRLNAVDDGLDHAAGLVAPAAGAAIVALLGIAAGAGVLAVLGLCAATVLTVALPGFRHRAQAAATPLSTVLRYVRGDVLLFRLTAMFALVIAIFMTLELVLLPAMIAEAGKGADTLAAFFFAAGLGGLAGAAAAGSVLRDLSVPALTALAFLMLACGAAIGALSIDGLVLTLCGALFGLAAGIVSPSAASLFQTWPPKALRADVQAVSGALLFAATPLALLAGGAMADLVPPVIAMAIAAAVLVALAALAWFTLPDPRALRPHWQAPLSRRGAP